MMDTKTNALSCIKLLRNAVQSIDDVGHGVVFVFCRGLYVMDVERDLILTAVPVCWICKSML